MKRHDSDLLSEYATGFGTLIGGTEFCIQRLAGWLRIGYTPTTHDLEQLKSDMEDSLKRSRAFVQITAEVNNVCFVNDKARD